MRHWGVSLWILGLAATTVVAAEPHGAMDVAMRRTDEPETLSSETTEEWAEPIANLADEPPPEKAMLPPSSSTDRSMPFADADLPGEEVIVDEPMGEQTQAYFSSPTGYGSWFPQKALHARIDYLYWEAKDPTNRSPVYRQQTTTFDGINTPVVTQAYTLLSDASTDHEMGFRAFLAHDISQNVALEWVGLWVYPTDYIKQSFFSQTAPSTLNPAQTTVQVFAYPTNDLLNVGTMSARSRYWGTEANGRFKLFDGSTLTVDGILGARYFGYFERLALETQGRIQNNVTPPVITERFETNNNMIGGQLGADVGLQLFEYIGLNWTGRIGLMGNVADVDIKGPGAGQGIFTDATNLGSHSDNQYTTLFETGLSLAWQLTPYLDFRAGYTIIWLEDQLRASNQVDVAGLAAGGSPSVPLVTEDMWIQGFTFTFSCNY